MRPLFAVPFSRPIGDVSLQGNSATKAYSRFLEIDAQKGDLIWRSERFIGQLREYSLVTIGNEPYLSKKIGVFDSGIYAFD